MKLTIAKSASMAFGSMVYLMSTGYSLAVDEKVYTGSGCQAYYGSQVSNFDHRGHRLENKVTSGRWAACPIARDNTSNTNGLPAVYVRMNRSTAATSSYLCYLKNYTSFGSQTSWDSAIYNGTGNYSMGLNLASTSSYGHYVVYCKVPRSSYLYNYRVIEN